MPHRNDGTLVTCAGDAEVRVFDIEYDGKPTGLPANGSARSAPSSRMRHLYKNVRYLSEGNTNARVYRSHADRVKRIVTESSPNLFLTCSEDGEVRFSRPPSDRLALNCCCRYGNSICGFHLLRTRVPEEAGGS